MEAKHQPRHKASETSSLLEQGPERTPETKELLEQKNQPSGPLDFEPIQVKSVSQAIRILEVGRTSFYRYVDQGKITVERVDTPDGLIYNVYKSPSQPQAALESKGALILGGVAMVTEPDFDQPEFRQPEAGPELVNIPHVNFFEEWISWKDEGVGTKTWSASHKRKCTHYAKLFFKDYQKVSYENLEKYMLETPVLRWSLRRAKHSAVSSYASFLYRKKRLISRTEYLEIRGLYPKKPKDYRREIKLIQEEHLEPILNAIRELHASNPYKVTLLTSLVLFLSETGLRISEAGKIVKENLSFSDDPEQAYIYLPEYITKNGKERYVPFTPPAQQAVREFFKVRPLDVAFDEVFLCHHRVWGYTTVKGTTIAHNFEDISAHCKIPFTAHSFRHYRITKWANDPEISITDVQYWAGHETLMVTQGYVHVRGKHSVKAAFGRKANKSVDLNNLVQLLEKLNNLGPEERQALLGQAVS